MTTNPGNGATASPASTDGSASRADEESRVALDKLAAGLGTDTHFPCWPAHEPERAMLTGVGS